MTTHLSLPHLSPPLKLWEKMELATGDGDEKGINTARIEDFPERAKWRAAAD